MIQLTETYTWKQTAAISKLSKLRVELKMISYAIDGKIDDIYILSQQAAMDGMKCFDKRLEEYWQTRKGYLLANFPKFDFNKRFRYNINGEPTGTSISFDKFVGFDYVNKNVNYQDYTGCQLANVLLSPPYGLNLDSKKERESDLYYDIKAKELTNIYRMFLNDFILLSEYRKDDLVIYSWSDDWSNFFDAGKEWWGTYYCTVYNKQNNTIIVLGASETD